MLENVDRTHLLLASGTVVLQKTLLITLDTYPANVLSLNLSLVLMIVLVFVQLTHVCFILSERVSYQQGIIPMTSSIPCAHKLTTKVRKTN